MPDNYYKVASYLTNKCRHNSFYYVAEDKKLRKNVLDSEAARGMIKGSDYYVVLAKK